MEPQLNWWPSPAKLNLFLHINRRLENGYHALQSLFQIVDQGDQLAFDVKYDSPAIHLMTPIEGVPNKNNLIVRAAHLLKSAYKNKHAYDLPGVKIYLRKNLPMGGGIGGGSSNAATTLVVLNHLWQCHFSVQELADLGLSLGADVPVFVHGNTAFAQGVGEKLIAVSQPEQYFLIVHPHCHISTADIFSAAELPRNTPEMAWQDYKFEKTRNDCQQLVCKTYPNVANILQWLLEYAPSRMTGTGACLFAVFEQESQAREVLKQLPDDCSGFVAKGVNVSPLQQMLAAQEN